jgi:ElaB/YqjD/DUF883 family membrane-anchored ribosome-binding protein
MASTLQKLNKSSDTADVSEQIATLRRDISALTQTISDLTKSKGDEAVSTAKSKLSDVRDQAVEASETPRLMAMELQDKTDAFIKKQPAAALGIAAGVGFLAGFLGSRNK